MWSPLCFVLILSCGVISDGTLLSGVGVGGLLGDGWLARLMALVMGWVVGLLVGGLAEIGGDWLI